MRYAILTLSTCAILFLSGCGAVLGVTSSAINGSGNLITQDYDFTGFDVIDAGSNFKVNVRRGDAFGVQVTADDNMLEHLQVTSSRGKLKLGLKPGTYSLNNVTMKADVTMPALKAVTGSENAVVRFDQFEPADLTLDLSGNAIAEGAVRAGKVGVLANGNGQARLSGETDNLDVDGKGNAILTMPDLIARRAVVKLDNNAMAVAQVTETLDYSLNGNAGLAYGGGAKLGKQQAGGNSWAKSQ